MKKITLVIAVIIIFTAKFAFSQTYDFDLQDTDGNSVKLSELLQKGPVFLQFWALWCVPCKEEMKQLNELHAKYKDSGFVYIAVNQDSPKSSAKVKSFIESKEYKFPVLLDPDTKVFEQFGGQNLPFSIFLSKKGDVLKTYTGYIQGDESKLESDIKQALSEAK
ncbi:MAG TPA: TlpA disulfide reductase family protein [Ignavibacteria bacterium]|jgi:thiol-disulfide isomerase/thioredoxin